MAAKVDVEGWIQQSRESRWQWLEVGPGTLLPSPLTFSPTPTASALSCQQDWESCKPISSAVEPSSGMGE